MEPDDDYDDFVEKVSQSILECEATLAEPSSYNRFHINRIKNIIAGCPAFYNEEETERRFITSNMTEKEKIKWIADEFANMQWTKKRQNDFDKKAAFFKKEITSFEKAFLWCDIAEIQLVPKGLMTPP